MNQADVRAIKAALTELPSRCRYHGDETAPDRFGQMTRSQSCCDTGRPAQLRKTAEEALARLQR